MSSMRTKVAGAGVAALLGMGGVVAVATSSGAQTDPGDPEAPTAATEVEEAPEELDGLDLDLEDTDEACEHDAYDEYELSPEELAELEAEVAALTTALDEAGVEYELIPEDDLGVAFPEPVGDDPAAWEAFEAVLIAQWAEEFASLPADEQAEIVEFEQAFADDLAAALDEAGVTYTVEADPVTGVEFPKFDEDDEAAWEVLDRIEDLDPYEAELDDPFLDELSDRDDRLDEDDDDLDDDVEDDLDDDDDLDDEAAA